MNSSWITGHSKDLAESRDLDRAVAWALNSIETTAGVFGKSWVFLILLWLVVSEIMLLSMFLNPRLFPEKINWDSLRHGNL